MSRNINRRFEAATSSPDTPSALRESFEKLKVFFKRLDVEGGDLFADNLGLIRDTGGWRTTNGPMLNDIHSFLGSSERAEAAELGAGKGRTVAAITARFESRTPDNPPARSRENIVLLQRKR